jgi:hypothetical protein
MSIPPSLPQIPLPAEIRPAPTSPLTAEERAERGRRAIREDFAANRDTYARLANR